MGRWQYQGKAEPLSLSSENVKLDWYRPALEAVRRKGVVTALITGAFFFTPVITAPETITLDKWQVSADALAYSAPARIQGGAVLVEAPAVTPDKWLGEAGLPRFGSFTRHLYQSYFSFNELPEFPAVEPLTLDKWWREISRPRFDKPRNQYLYPSFFSFNELPAALVPEALTFSVSVFRNIRHGVDTVRAVETHAAVTRKIIHKVETR